MVGYNKFKNNKLANEKFGIQVRDELVFIYAGVLPSLMVIFLFSMSCVN